jgi:GT2 family glycosyltransferase
VTDAALGPALMFSVLVAAYQSVDTIGETLDSLIAQDFAEWEAVVVDDGSTDGTAAVAERHARRDGRIRVLRQANTGTALARNAAASVARGRWLLPLDGDDLLLPEALSTHSAFIAAHPGFELYSWASDILLPDGSRKPFDDSPEYGRVTSFSLADLVERNRLLSYTAIDAAMFARLGGYRDVYVEDYDLWLRAMAAGARHIHDPRPLAVYRYCADGKNSDIERSFEGTARILRDLVATPELPSAVAMQAVARAAELEGAVARSRLEDALARGRFARARRAYWRARRAYTHPLKRWIGLAAVAVSPRLLARLLRVGRSEAPWPSSIAVATSTDAPRVTVVVPNWNGLDHLRECLAALREQTFCDFITVLVDNGSTDGSVSLVRSEYPEVLVIETGANLGFAGAVNLGIRATRSPLIALLNNDTHADPAWLQNLVMTSEALPSADSFASLMVLYDHREIVNAAGDEYLPAKATAVNRGMGRPLEEYRQPSWVFGACAGASMYRRGFFDKVGLFDEQYFLMHEDTDLNMRGQLMGLRAAYVPEAVVAHKVGASLGTQPSLKTARLRWRNEALVAAKTLPWVTLFAELLVLALRDVRETFPVRPRAWRGGSERLRRLPTRCRARFGGVAAGLRSRPDLPPRRVTARQLRRNFRAWPR